MNEYGSFEFLIEWVEVDGVTMEGTARSFVLLLADNDIIEVESASRKQLAFILSRRRFFKFAAY